MCESCHKLDELNETNCQFGVIRKIRGLSFLHGRVAHGL
jgi:hypothetical protein